MLKINEAVYQEVSEKLLDILKDPDSNLEEFRDRLIRLDYKENTDVILELPMGHKGFGLKFKHKSNNKTYMVGGLVYNSHDNSWGVHT